MFLIDWILKRQKKIQIDVVKNICDEIEKINAQLHSLHQSMISLESKALIIREAAYKYLIMFKKVHNFP